MSGKGGEGAGGESAKSDADPERKHRRSLSVPQVSMSGAFLSGNAGSGTLPQPAVQERILQRGMMAGDSSKHRKGEVSAEAQVDMPDLVAEAPELMEEHRMRLQGWRELRLRQAISSQLQRRPALPARWQGTLELMATRAADSLLPDSNASINSILKIKTLPGGSRADSHYVDGLVCRLKLAHKCMRTQLDAPRILLLKPPLEHDSAGFSSSLDALRQQEDEHMEMTVGRMAKLAGLAGQPDTNKALPQTWK